MTKAESGKRKADWVCCLAVAFLGSSSLAEEKAAAPKFTTETLRGRVVFLAEALEKKYGVKSVTEAKEAALALQDDAGKLHPLVEDVRGRAFRVDKRLRDIKVELLVRRYQDSPAAQVIGVYEVAKDGRFEIDYWCSVCAIAMYELKQCECCQGETELRKRKAEGK
ncbi:MAG: hypothetical protein ACR2FY_24980 [Pirellulaceae bacterium]